MVKVLITCPPMLKQIEKYRSIFDKNGIDIHTPNVEQTLSEQILIGLVPKYDGWIVGDDPVTENVVAAGTAGNLRGIVKWGVGTDNVDFEACRKYGVKVSNTPGMFGEEVADLAVCYLIMLSRHVLAINNSVKSGGWAKITGSSLQNKKLCLVGFGDIGRSIARRLLSMRIDVWVSDPGFDKQNDRVVCNYGDIEIEDCLHGVTIGDLDSCLTEADYVIVACALNSSTYHMIGDNLWKCNTGVRLVNISRGPIIDERTIIKGQEEEWIGPVAFDVFEKEPLPMDNGLRDCKDNIFGCHNGSNTFEAVDRASHEAIRILLEFLEV